MQQTQKSFGDRIWTMRDGTEIRWGDMTISHLINTANMLRRQARKADHSLALTYVCTRGDAATEAALSEMDAIGSELQKLKQMADDMELYANDRDN